MVEMSMILARLKREPLANLPLGPDLDQALRQLGHAWRDRLLPPLVTLKLFLIQVLAGNCSIAALRQLAGVDFAPSSYSDARKRLPLDVLQWLLQWLQERAQQSLGIARKIGPRILITDGSSYSMPEHAGTAGPLRPAGGDQAGRGVPQRKTHGTARRGHGDVPQPAGPAAVHPRHARRHRSAPHAAGGRYSACLP